MHESGLRKPLYGAVPYVTSHSSELDSSVLWVNAAETWLDLEKTEDDATAFFVSEGGTLDAFLLTSTCPKRLLKTLAEVTGFAPLPPIYSLGFHFS